MQTAHTARGRRREATSLRKWPSRGGKRPEGSNEKAFEAFYRRHVRDVYQYALAVLTNPADAEDVTQQTFLNAYRAFQRGERPEVPHNWLIKIAHNVCRMRWRTASRRPQEVALEEVREPAVYDEDKPTVDDVLRALETLPFNQRAALVMREVEGRNYNEIADVMNVSVAAVEALLFRARTNLRMRRRSLGVLTTVPLPAKLATAFGGGGGLFAAGSAVVGSDLALKAAAVVAGGIVAAGAGYQTVKAVTKPRSNRVYADVPNLAPPRAVAAPLHAVLTPKSQRSEIAGAAPAERMLAAKRLERRQTAPGESKDGSGAAASPAPGTGAAPPPAGGLASNAPSATSTVNGVLGAVKPPIPTPTTPSTPVQLPPTPTLPSVTVPTVPVLPPPPPLP